MLSAGLLGGPGIGYKQDYFAFNNLKQTAPAVYERYKTDEPKAFLLFPKIAGLDQAKITTLNDGGKQLHTDVAVYEKSGRKLSDDRSLESLLHWWNNAKDEAGSEAMLLGGKMALKWTALVPVGMALGYLLLLLYFRRGGGYKQVHIEPDRHAEADDAPCRNNIITHPLENESSDRRPRDRPGFGSDLVEQERQKHDKP